MKTILRSGLTDMVRWIHSRGWAPGTGGNFSELLSRDPLKILMSPSGVDKGQIDSADMIVVDGEGRVLSGVGRPSAETLLHCVIYQETGAGVVLHTHSVWNTLASLSVGDAVRIGGFEMLKGLSGVTTHEHEEIIPVLGNSQDMVGLSVHLGSVLRSQPGCHGVLLRGHGLYTWGVDLSEAKRHLEVLEFLFEVTGQMRKAN